MNDLLLYVATANLLLVATMAAQLIWGLRRLANLQDIAPLESDCPTMTIVVAARNEERHIATALDSLLGLDYPDLRIIVVDDRSTDGTGEILDRCAAASPRLHVEHITELPAGWIGKNHALWRGAQHVDTELILFTDADVIMEPSTLRRAARYLVEHQVDHLPLFFRVRMPTWFLQVFVLLFWVVFCSWFRPWKVSDPRSRAYVGVGGFNLIRSSVYRAIGTLEAIRMRPDDDVKLGKLVKLHGFRQHVVLAADFVEVPWYSSVGELVRGLEKNSFAGVDYRIGLTVVSSLLMLLFHVFPFIAVLVTEGVTRWLYAAVVLCLLGVTYDLARRSRQRASLCLGYPLAALLFVVILWRTMLLNLVQRGIRWRGTHYSLAELKANKI